MKNWKIYLIQHSHTDIGYTERQEKLKKYHVDFILQAIDMLDKIHSDENKYKDYLGFIWQCENHWQVENFYTTATKEQKEAFEKYVKSGEIGLSGNYLNLTELIDYDILYSRINKSKVYGQKVGVNISCGMTADVNGYAWGYVDALVENGVENLFTAIHTHHGMFPLYKKQTPFYWQSPKGNKLLVWNGEHYHIGNYMYICPNAGGSYMFSDDIKDRTNGDNLRSQSAKESEQLEIEFATTRITRYIENLEKEGYEYDFLPMMISGVHNDNSPPNLEIAKRIKVLNNIFAGKIEIVMATLDDFFDVVNASGVSIPTYSGDFPDWWADGVGSTSSTVKIFREAQRKYNLCKKLDKDNTLGNPELVEKASENLIMYAEHTWGYSSSISEPWNSLVACLEKKKDACAINANTQISTNLDIILSKLGEKTITANKDQRYKIINPHNITYKGGAKLCIELWETLDGVSVSEHAKIIATDEATGENLKCQLHKLSRSNEIEVAVELAPHEEKTIKITQTFENTSTILNHAYVGSEGVKDIINKKAYIETPYTIETNYYTIKFSQQKGIHSIFDKTNNTFITDEKIPQGLFSGVYEYTPDTNVNKRELRRSMGRNRCNNSTQRDFGHVVGIVVVENGDVFITTKISYKLEGTGFYDVYLKVYKTTAQIEARVCLHKKSVWEPENVYVALPFKVENSQTYIDKTGCILRPGIDQLIGSCQDFYCIQNGIYKAGEYNDVLIAIKDAPLISFGSRGAKPIELCGGNNIVLNNSTAYSWIMNNFWETNFKADLGGFYEFRYTVTTQKFENPTDAIEYLKLLNEGILEFYI